MQKNENVHKSEFKGAHRQQRKIVLPITDPRNNRTFRNLHPEVVFEGRPEKQPTEPDHYGHVAKQHPKTRSYFSANTHSPPQTPIAGSVPDSMVNTSRLNASHAQEDDPQENDSHSFIFHEVADEAYSIEHHVDMHGESNNADGIPVPHEGVAAIPIGDGIPVPTNLSVVDITVDDAQTNSGDGNPTYMAKLLFQYDGMPEDYEIRIVKAS